MNKILQLKRELGGSQADLLDEIIKELKTTPLKTVQEELDQHAEQMRSEDFEYYRDTLELEEGDDVLQAIVDSDYEGDEFNITFEQGYRRALEIILTNLK